MKNQVDARGEACPVPVIMAKKEADGGKEEFSVLVDNLTAVENLNRFGSSYGYQTVVNKTTSDFEVVFSKTGETHDVPETFAEDMSRAGGNKRWAVFVAKEIIGDGDPELGKTLMKMFIYTLSQDDNVPSYILFMNAGVKLSVESEQIIEHLKVLQEKGTKILICGTCLNFYGLSDKLEAGTVSNMYDIVDAMRAVEKVITV